MPETESIKTKNVTSTPMLGPMAIETALRASILELKSLISMPMFIKAEPRTLVLVLRTLGPILGSQVHRG